MFVCLFVCVGVVARWCWCLCVVVPAVRVDLAAAAAAAAAAGGLRHPRNSPGK